MAHGNDTVKVDELWRIFDGERNRAWRGVDASPGEFDFEVAAGKIQVINNICTKVRAMNGAERSSADKAEPPIWKAGESIVHTDYADGSADTKLNRWAAWLCPKCGWFVGEQFIPIWKGHKPHNQQKCNFCSRCGQRIDWEEVSYENHQTRQG